MPSNASWRTAPRYRTRGSTAPAHHAAPAAVPRPRVAASTLALPAHRYEQQELARAAASLLPALRQRDGLVERFFRRVGVRGRNLALPAEAYEHLDGFEARNRAWVEVATDLGETCLRRVCAEADVAPGEISMLMSTTVTGLAVPSIDALLMNRLPLRQDLKRMPLFGLGCLGGAAGLARASEYLRAFPDQLAVLLSVELCSLTFQRGDASIANLVSTGLFGDGAAAVLLAGAEHPLAQRGDRGRGGAMPRVEDSRSAFFPNTERAMGWDIVDDGFKVVLDRGVPDLVARELPPAVDAFLSDHDLERGDVARWVSHPGGPSVMDAVEEALELPTGTLDPSREALAEVGNLSSASVLGLLDRHRRSLRPDPGERGLLIAMGPAFCAELVLLRW